MNMTIHRKTNYMKLVASVRTTASEAGEMLEAWKDSWGWHVWNPKTDKVFFCPLATLRATTGLILEQSVRDTPPEWSVIKV
ncbi:MAG: hypothetical protein J6R54_01890 [Bacteroidaceae bacterium]|nr:hypothetical protein [Bacteroidaceae bacterium]